MLSLFRWSVTTDVAARARAPWLHRIPQLGKHINSIRFNTSAAVAILVPSAGNTIKNALGASGIYEDEVTVRKAVQAVLAAERLCHSRLGAVTPEQHSHAIWVSASRDVDAVDSGNDARKRPLWHPITYDGSIRFNGLWRHDGQPISFANDWQAAKTALSAKPEFGFWIRWYEAALEGHPLTSDWDSHATLLTDIAVIPDDDWGKDAVHVARLIAEIEERYKRKADVMIRPATLEVSIHGVQRAVVVNRLTLPPTFDAVYGQINLEIQRLQGINCWDSDEQCEQARALIRRLTAMAEAVQNLRTSVEAASTEPTEVEAAKTKSLLEHYAGHLKSWPRDNAADLTDSVWRLGLSGASTGLMAMLGVPLPLAFGLSGALFGGKKLTDALKASADSKSVIGG